MTTETILQIIALAWLACLEVEWFITLCIKAKQRITKPLGCQACMGFWIGTTVFTILMDIQTGITYGLITSLTAVLISALTKHVNRGGI